MSLLELKQVFIWVFILLLTINFVVRGKYEIPINLFIDKKKLRERCYTSTQKYTAGTTEKIKIKRKSKQRLLRIKEFKETPQQYRSEIANS